jgi:hypothetical protein
MIGFDVLPPPDNNMLAIRSRNHVLVLYAWNYEQQSLTLVAWDQIATFFPWASTADFCAVSAVAAEPSEEAYRYADKHLQQFPRIYAVSNHRGQSGTVDVWRAADYSQAVAFDLYADEAFTVRHITCKGDWIVAACAKPFPPPWRECMYAFHAGRRESFHSEPFLVNTDVLPTCVHIVESLALVVIGTSNGFFHVLRLPCGTPVCEPIDTGFSSCGFAVASHDELLALSFPGDMIQAYRWNAETNRYRLLRDFDLAHMIPAATSERLLLIDETRLICHDVGTTCTVIWNFGPVFNEVTVTVPDEDEDDDPKIEK